MGLLGPGVAPGPAAGVPRVPAAGGTRVRAVPAKGGSVRRIKRDNLAVADDGAGREAPAKPAPVSEPKPAAAAARGRAAGPVQESGSTRVIPPAQAAELGLARETIVVKSGNRVREYSQGRVIVGRASDADFRIDNPDVSRRHAAIFWSNGKIVVEDLGSTNGTMVNGYPVSSTVIAPNDVIVIGDCKLTVQAR